MMLDTPDEYFYTNYHYDVEVPQALLSFTPRYVHLALFFDEDLLEPLDGLVVRFYTHDEPLVVQHRWYRPVLETTVSTIEYHAAGPGDAPKAAALRAIVQAVTRWLESVDFGHL
jgi:hypothetical protein